MTELLLDLEDFLDSMVRRRPSLWTRWACGVTRSGRDIPALLDRDAYIPTTQRARVLLVAGLSGRVADLELAMQSLDMFASSGQRFAGSIALSAVPCGYPDGLASDGVSGNDAGGDPSTGYPPEGQFYDHHTDPERRYLWRWVSFQAPDLVLEVVPGDRVQWQANRAAKRLAPAVAAANMPEDGSLLSALGLGTPNGLDAIPGLRLIVHPRRLGAELGRLLSFIPQFPSWEPSPARRALDLRRSRSRLRTASILDSIYGHSPAPKTYAEGVAISGRLRLASLSPNAAAAASDVAGMLSTDGAAGAAPFGGAPTSADLAGVIWGTELADITGDRRWSDLVVRAADHYRPSMTGGPPAPADPDFRTEDIFTAGAILGRAFQVTGESRYLELLTRFLSDLDTQEDNGLFRHCPSAPYFWGIGNGFAALGLAESLTYTPEGSPGKDAILEMYSALMDGFRSYQQPSGMFPQVLDVKGSYQEFTGTCMFGYAAARGLRLGWLDLSFLEPLQLAWQGVNERIDDEGNVVDACGGAGPQACLRDYLHCPAVFGKDDWAGGMALWFAAELEHLAQHSLE